MKGSGIGLVPELTCVRTPKLLPQASVSVNNRSVASAAAARWLPVRPPEEGVEQVVDCRADYGRTKDAGELAVPRRPAAAAAPARHARDAARHREAAHGAPCTTPSAWSPGGAGCPEDARRAATRAGRQARPPRRTARGANEGPAGAPQRGVAARAAAGRARCVVARPTRATAGVARSAI